MTKLIIGSTAAKLHYPDFPRSPKDLDVFAGPSQHIPVEDAFWHPKFGQWLDEDCDSRYATPTELRTIKLSHAAWEIRGSSWFKHMDDYWFLTTKGAGLDETLYNMLYSVWEERYGKKVIDLNYDKAAFFDDAVARKYDHDSVHRSVACEVGHPEYEKYLDGEVKIDMKKVWAAGFTSQMILFGEEIAATALERYVIPSDYTCSPLGAWRKALRKTVTSLTKGKSSQFIAMNYGSFRNPLFDYVERHKNNRHYLEEL